MKPRQDENKPPRTAGMVPWIHAREVPRFDLLTSLRVGDFDAINARDGEGFTQLLTAVESDCKELSEYLIQKGADLKAKSNDGRDLLWDVTPPAAGYPGWLLELATAVCGEMLSPRGVLEHTNQVQSLDQLRQTLGGQSGSDDWSILGRWLLANPSVRTISPFSRITRGEWIEHRFSVATSRSLTALERLAMLTGDATLLERVFRAVESAGEAKALLGGDAKTGDPNQ